MYSFIASVLGIGYIRKGGGTVAAIAFTLLWWFFPVNWYGSIFLQLFVCVLLLVVGVWSAHQMEPHWGKDSYRVVIDEVAGMAITLIAVPHNWKYALTGLVAFRFFDIVKPLGIRSLERWKGGWGVMADDTLAGIYAWGITQFIVRSSVWG